MLGRKNLKKSKFDIHDILGMCRSQGYFNIQDVEYAILETSGEMSILPKSLKNPLLWEIWKIQTCLKVNLKIMLF